MNDWVEVRLTPVRVFGAGCDEPACSLFSALSPDERLDEQICPDADKCMWGYGLCDAVSPESDCNRAVNHIFRVEDNRPVDQADFQAEVDERTVWVRVRRSDLPRLGKEHLFVREIAE